MRVSSTIAFQAQVPYNTLTNMRETRQSEAEGERTCEFNYHISGPSPLPHTDKCERDSPARSGGGAHVSATVTFLAQVHYHTLTSLSVVETSQSGAEEERTCECNHHISGPGPLPHTDKCEGGAPVRSGGGAPM